MNNKINYSEGDIILISLEYFQRLVKITENHEDYLYKYKVLKRFKGDDSPIYQFTFNSRVAAHSHNIGKLGLLLYG